ncbi:MAG: CRISPR-associated ring nuclease Csm6 [Verrucomicrobiales bacterium]|nr:TIGR02584 family CRISPR-associated protein [Verrucomicrobiae bacterium]MCP5555400.1 TIGR02584 family CRISPR-associated protein [Akkermansiaceae bacterium]
METILVAVLGTSPGILTETVWALATQSAAPVIPDRVCVITTQRGAAMARKELLCPSAVHEGRTVWDAMTVRLTALGFTTKNRLRFGGPSLRVFPNGEGTGHLEDIRGAGDNEVAADFILQEVRGLQGEDNRLIGSVAGGRKTMSTLLYAVFSLIGRPQDRLTHVLVNDPFESPGLEPRFYFPSDPVQIHRGRDRDGQVVAEARSDEARLELADIPFVRVRRLFLRDFHGLPGRFTSLVAQYNEEGAGSVSIVFDDRAGRAHIDGTEVNFGPRDHALFAFLVERARNGESPAPSAQDTAAALVDEHNRRWLARHPDIEAKYRDHSWVRCFDSSEVRGALGQIRRLLRDAGLREVCNRLLPPRGPVGWDPAKTIITIQSREL